MRRVSQMSTSAPKPGACGRKLHCTATTAAGTPCKAWATHNSDPPRCSAHSGAPTGNVSAGKHRASATHSPDSAPVDSPSAASDLPGAPGLDKDGALSGGSALPRLVTDLKRRIDQLSAYIDAHIEDLDPADYARLGTLQGQLVSRLSRLNKEMAAEGTGGGALASGALAAAIDDALDQLGAEWGITL